MNSTKQRRTRSGLLVNRRFQTRIVAMILLAGILCVGITANLCYAYLVESYDFLLRRSDLPPALIDQQYRDLYTFLASLSVVNLVIVAVVAVWALFITHRAAGAIYHMRKVIDQITSGDAAARVKLREKDDFQELATAFNAMMDGLQAKTR